ncbi:MAG: hypothetical protein KGS61_15415, partial [Verrucomicrobia bacterium]|nr:hypothetical protein [Verrucomicrobiota bacterium]
MTVRAPWVAAPQRRVSAFIPCSRVDLAPSALASFLSLELLLAPPALGQSPATSPTPSLEQAEALAAKGKTKRAIALYEQLAAPTQPVFIRRGALGALFRLDPTGAEPRILKVLHSQDDVLKPVAIAEIATLPAPDASKRFGQEMPRLQPDEQIWLIQALAGRGDTDARAAIRAAVGAADVTVRLAAIGAVGELEDAGAVASLVSALASARDAVERRKLEFALAGLKGGDATDQAILGEFKPSSPATKQVLIAVLVRRQCHAAVPTLLSAAGGSDPAVVPAAFEGLGKLAAADDLPAMLNALVGLQAVEARPDAENAVIAALTRSDNPAQSAEAVWNLLVRTPEVEARCSLLRLLPACPDAKGLLALNAARQDSDPALRETAV